MKSQFQFDPFRFRPISLPNPAKVPEPKVMLTQTEKTEVKAEEFDSNNW
jgi:hypothetical protein